MNRQGTSRSAALGMMIALLASPSAGAQGVITGDSSFVSPTARFEKLFGQAGSNTEGPAVARDGSVFFVDAPAAREDGIPAGRIWRLDPNTRAARIFRSPSNMALGLEFDSRGRLVIAEFGLHGGRRVTRIDLETGDGEVVAALYQGRPFSGVNDLTIDERGRIYFTEYDLVAPHDGLYQRTPGVYRVDPDGTVQKVIPNAGLPNGIVISPDQKTLYVSTFRFDLFGQKALLAYDVAPDGKVSFRSVLVRYDLEPGGQAADGMAVDTDGNLWVAVFARNAATGVAVYSPTGHELAFIPTPEPAKNVAFGRGADRNVLYVTAGASLYRIRVKKEGYQLPTTAAAESSR